VKAILWLLMLCLLVGLVATPITYLYTLSQLPQLESELDLEKLLRLGVEGTRRDAQRAMTDDLGPIPFERPEIAQVPKDLVALYTSQRGCPTFFQTPREEGARWGWRLFVGLLDIDLSGDGWCERTLAMRLATKMGAKGKLQATVAAQQIHKFMAKDQLVAYDMATMEFDYGVVGVESAARQLFKQRLDELSLAQLAELMMVLPPHGYWSQLQLCQNPALLKLNRDQIIQQLASEGLVAPDRAGVAMSGPVSCTLTN
jgi:hypothetical protein